MPDKKTVAAAGGEDRLSALPVDVLLVVLSSMPSVDAVRTSVLARRWRHLWKSTRAVRIARHDMRPSHWTPWKLNAFVNRLLLARGCAPLDELEVDCGEIDSGENELELEHIHHLWTRERNKELSRFAGAWIQHVLSFCQARVLRFFVHIYDRRLQIEDVFISQLLTTVDLSYTTLRFRSLDFSGCPALEDLKLFRCSILGDRILSGSLRRLSITGCDFHPATRCRISAPRLKSLELAVFSGRAPFLDIMPLLVTACVRLQHDMCHDICEHKHYYGDCGDAECHGCHGSSGDGSSVLLQSLSSTTALELTSYPDVFIFRKDINFCSTFSNLKELLLNEWCLEPEFHGLVYFLRYSPVMEKLTVQLQDQDCLVQPSDNVNEIDENCNPTPLFSVSEQLKKVKIEWYRKDELVEKIVTILCTYGVPRGHIDIEQIFDLPQDYCSETEDSDDNW